MAKKEDNLDDAVYRLTPFGILHFHIYDNELNIDEIQSKLVIKKLEDKDVLNEELFIEACNYADIKEDPYKLKYLYRLFVEDIRKAGYTK